MDKCSNAYAQRKHLNTDGIYAYVKCMHKESPDADKALEPVDGEGNPPAGNCYMETTQYDCPHLDDVAGSWGSEGVDTTGDVVEGDTTGDASETETEAETETETKTNTKTNTNTSKDGD